jgi:hypothetical protein
MPLSNSSVRVIDPVLSNVAQGYNILDMVGNKLFPRVPVQTRGGQIIEFGREAFRLYQTKRSPGGRTARIQFGYLGKPFALFQDAVEAPVPREYQQDAKVVPGLDLGRRAVNVGMRNMLLSLEVDQANTATNASSYSAGNKVALAGATKWSASTGNPLTDIDTGREAIRQATGMYPNTLVLSAVAFNACKNNPNIVARFQYNGKAGTDASQITPQMLAGLFNLKEVVVGGGIYWNDANVSADIWGNNAVLAYVPPPGDLSIEEPSYGYTYTFEGNPLVEEPYWEPQSKSWVYGVTYERVPVLSGISAGYLIQNPN